MNALAKASAISQGVSSSSLLTFRWLIGEEHLLLILRIMSQTFFDEVLLFSFETYCLQDFHLLFLMVRRAFALEIRNCERLSEAGLRLNLLRASFLAFIACLHSSVNQDLGGFLGSVEV